MAIKFHAGDRITGLSTDAKPMFVASNSIFYETDTNVTSDFDGSSWTARATGVTGSMTGHVIPSANDTYDIGSAEYKVRDMYVSDNSLWVGDDHKVEIAGGKMKFKKRKNNRVPDVITSAGGSEAGAKSNRSRSNLTDMTLNDWVKYAQSLGGSLANAKPNDIFKSDDADDWESDEASITSEQASAITANTAKTGITSGQTSAITANTAKVGVSNGVVTDAHLAGSISLSKLSNGTAGKILGFNESTGALEEQDAPSGGGSTFGNGADGALTVSSSTTLSKAINQYTDVTINAGTTLSVPSGQRSTMILAQNSITINGTISVVGMGGDGGAGTTSNSNRGSGGTGVGGNGSSGNSPSNTVSVSGYRINGGGGASGGSGGGGGSGGAGAGGNGAGGGGGSGSIGTDSNDTWTQSGYEFLPTVYNDTTGWGTGGGGGGQGGGGGGGAGRPQSGTDGSGGAGGMGGLGGAGGAGGGTIFLIAPSITFGSSGMVTCAGASGSNGGGGGNGSAGGRGRTGDGGGGGGSGGGGGGKGGNGGFMLLVYTTLTLPAGDAIADRTDISGGAGGAGGALGNGGSSSYNPAGTAGTAGNASSSGQSGIIIQLIA